MPAPSTTQKRRGASPFHGEFARQLQGHTPHEQRREVPPSDLAPQDHGAPSPSNLDEPEPEPTTSDEDHAPLEGEALFEHVLETMTPKDLFAGKYHGSIKNLPKPKVKPEPFAPGQGHAQKKSKAEQERDEQIAREQLSELREEMLFTRAVGHLDEVFTNQQKYHRQRPNAAKEREERTGYGAHPPEGLITPPLPKQGEGLNRIEALHPEHRGLLNRAKLWARRESMETLNLRGDGVEDALRQLELFVHKSWKEGALYVRIVHGRGVQSEEGIPVLKPSVLHWLEGPGYRYVRGYAPELTSERDYGSLIVSLTVREAQR